MIFWNKFNLNRKMYKIYCTLRKQISINDESQKKQTGVKNINHNLKYWKTKLKACCDNKKKIIEIFTSLRYQ